VKPGIEEFPGSAHPNGNVRWPQSAGHYYVPVKKNLASVREQRNVRVQTGGIGQGRKQEIDIDSRTNPAFQSVGRLLVFLQFADFFPVRPEVSSFVFLIFARQKSNIFASFSSGVLAPGNYL
jgi:hypothetical protein